ESIVKLLSVDMENQKQIHQIMIHGNYVLISILMNKIEVSSVENHIFSYSRNVSLEECIELASDTYNHIQEVFPNSYIARFFQNREKVLNIINHLLGKEQIIELQE
ncbi:AIPR protein, partial [Escherichia coli]